MYHIPQLCNPFLGYVIRACPALKMASDREMLSQYIQEKEDYVASVLERLGWEKEYLEENVRIASNVKADARIQSSACSVI